MNMQRLYSIPQLNPKPAPLAVFTAEFPSAENLPKKALASCLFCARQSRVSFCISCDVEEILLCRTDSGSRVLCSVYRLQNTCLPRSRLLLTDSSFLVYCVMCNTSAVFQPKMLVVSRILAVFLLIAIIRLSRISAEISFQPSGI